MDMTDKVSLITHDGKERDVTGLLRRMRGGAGVDYDEIRRAATELETLAIAAKAARDAFAEAVKTVAERAGMDTTVLRSWVNARIADETEKKRHQAEQLSLLFDEIGQ